MKRLQLIVLATFFTTVLSAQSLKEAYAAYWRMGMSVNQWEVEAEQQIHNEHDVTGAVSADQTAHFPLIVQHFDWLVAENCMKCEVMHPKEGVYDFTLADKFVDKALANDCHVVGHCLIWHSQCAPWFFTDSEGKQVSADVLKKRMREHIYTIVGHFRGRVEAWDVVNEAFEDDGSMRKSKFYEILGEDYIPLAFQYAHEADPSAELYYNDYSMNKATKVEGVVNYFRPLMAKGMPITAIGLQGHLIYGDTDYVKEYAHTIEKIASIGLKAQFTELDMSVLPNPYGFSGANVSDRFKYSEQMDPYKNGLPAEKQAQVDQFWVDFFSMLMQHKRDVLRVGFWCLNDANSWRNSFPIRGRTDYATLFDRQNQPKPTIQKLIDLATPKMTGASKKQKKNSSKY
ncbi:MAG: endo-1,4-beta-xylanase [Bacteroidaceae bacterium]|nr:endo-1,4-beta-xylanase [Bacteroidaceae bacterium]